MKKRIACLLLTLVMLVGLIPVTAIRASAASITVSEAGIRVIKEYMGFHKNAYKVAEGVYKIGYGTPSVEGATITEANADQLLREKLAKITKDISDSGKITATLVQKRMDALVWLSYVEETSWLDNATLVNAINSSTTGSAFVNAMVTYSCGSGFTDDAANRSVLNRRLAMANLYLNGSYSATDTGSLGYTVFDAGEGASFPGGARKMVQAFVGTSVTKINVPNPSFGTAAQFLGWYTGNAMVSGVGAATKGSVLTAHWQKTDEKQFASYTLPAYVIYEATGTADNAEVAIYKTPTSSDRIDVLKRDSVITVVAEQIVGGAKWLQLSTGGWVKLCSSLGDVPVTISPVTVTITDDYVNIRKNPSVTAAKVGTAKRGETRTIAMLSDDGKWGYCSAGWIFLAYTDYYGTSSSGGSSSPVTGTPGTVTGAPEVNVRIAAGVGNNLATTLAEGTSISVYEQTTVNGVAWGRIDQGWICMQYVKLQQSAVNSGSNISTGASAVVSSSVSLNVRSGPGTTYSKISTLAPGTSVVILRKETVNGATWGLIDQGWINLSYVTPIGSSAGGSSSAYSVGGTVVNCSSGVNIRAAAGTTNALVGVAGVGTRVSVTELTTVNGYKWGHIDRGWVCMDYIQLDSEFKQPEPIAPGKEDDQNNVVASFQGYPATVNEGNADLWDGDSGKILLTLKANAPVNLLAMTATAGKVTVGDKTGWVDLSNVTINEFNAKVTASKADVYEEPSTRSKFYASLVNGTYITIPTSDKNANWKVSDGVLWGKITATVSDVSYTGWLKLSDVTMFKGNALPKGITTFNGVGYLSGTIVSALGAVVYQDKEGNVGTDSTGYTLSQGTQVNILARQYVPGTDGTVTIYGKVTVGSVTGWINMRDVVLSPVPMKANVDISYYASESVTTPAGTLWAGSCVTITERYLVRVSNEINHGIVDVGRGYVNDNTADIRYFILDDGKLVPTGNASVDDPSNPLIVSSVVMTGKANVDYGLSIYEEAVDGSTVLLTVAKGNSITILNWKNVDGITWGKVQLNKVVGWVKTNEIDFFGLKGAVAVDELRVYNNADTTSAVQVLRVNGKAIEVYSVYFDGSIVWGKVAVAGYTGWIDLSNVTLNTPGIKTEVDPSNLPIMAKGKINSVKATVNVDGDVTTLPKGTEVSLIKVKMESGKALWLVELGDKDGWIEMDCVTMYSSIATITESSAPIYDDTTCKTTLYTLYRGEKATVLSYYVSGGYLYGEVACDDTTGWIRLCDSSDKMYVSLTPGSTGSGINTGSGSSGSAATEPTTPVVQATDAYISCATTVNVRSGAGVDQPLVTTLGNGTNVKIYEQTTVLGKQWARIDQGWVCMDYVKLGTLINIPSGGNALNGGSGTATIMTSVPAGAIAVGYANQDIKIRSGSGLGYPEVGSVAKGYSIVIYENKLDGGMSWGRTDNGWVCTSYLTITGIGTAGSGNMGTIGGVGFVANVRGTASSNGALMAKVMVSSRVAVHETTVVGTETWGRTDLGWINMQYVVLDSAAAPIPGVPGATTPDATAPTETTDTSVG